MTVSLTPVVLSKFEFKPSGSVQEALDVIGRTEDIQFSPDQKRLAIAGYSKHVLLILEFVRSADQDWAVSGRSLKIASDDLKFPHGLAWLNNETIIVANRGGKVAIFDIPPLEAGSTEVRLEPIRILQAEHNEIIKTPGSVCVNWLDADRVDVLVCNNYVHTVSHHRLSKSRGWAPLEENTVFDRGLDVPDSVAFSGGGRLIAVSNHNKHRVDVFSGYSRRPVCKIADCRYPHGIRFAHGSQFIIVADAGAPLVHVYRSERGDWKGWRSPVASIRVLSDEAFNRFSKGRGEGGPKGIDLTKDADVMVVSNEDQPLAFFKIGPLFEQLSIERRNSDRYQPKLYELALDAAPRWVIRNRRLRLLAGRIANARHFRRAGASAGS